MSPERTILRAPKLHEPLMLWPKGANMEKGFSSTELELLCGESKQPNSLRRVQSPALFWASEMYGYGNIFRSMLGWPQILPIPSFSDHGIHPEPLLKGPELSNKSRLHLTWSSWRESGDCYATKQLIRVPHPYAWMRRELKISLSSNAEGTILFIPHSLPGSERGYKWDTYIPKMLSSKKVPRPRAICLAMHDVNSGLHLKLARFGLPILTAGNSASALFPYRFYDIIRRFSFALSSEFGTQSFLCEELGVEYFLDNTGPADYEHAEKESSSYRIRSREFHNLLEAWPRNQETRASIASIVRMSMNLDLLGKIDKRRIRKQFALELLRLIPQIVLIEGPRYLGKKAGFFPRRFAKWFQGGQPDKLQHIQSRDE